LASVQSTNKFPIKQHNFNYTTPFINKSGMRKSVSTKVSELLFTALKFINSDFYS
jgi:hypothetical protein